MTEEQALVREMPEFWTRRFRMYVLSLAWQGFRRVVVVYDYRIFPYKKDVAEVLSLATRWSKTPAGCGFFKDDSVMRLAFAMGEDLSLRQLHRKAWKR